MFCLNYYLVIFTKYNHVGFSENGKKCIYEWLVKFSIRRWFCHQRFKTRDFIYFFRSQDFLTTLKTDLDKLTAHVRQNYPDDELLKNWVTYYNQTGRVGLDEMIHPPVRRKQMTNEEKKDKLKSVLLKSYSEERMLTDTVTPHYDTLQQCLETIQNCERLINSGKLSVLHHFR